MLVTPEKKDKEHHPYFKTMRCVAGLLLLLTPLAQAIDNASSTSNSGFSINRNDRSRPVDQFQTLLFGRPFTIGGSFEHGTSYRDNYNLGEKKSDKFLLSDQYNIEMLYSLSASVSAYVELKTTFEADIPQNDEPVETEISMEHGESWLVLYYTRWWIDIGHLNFQEKREWWWNEDLDAIRFNYQNNNLLMYFGFAEEGLDLLYQDTISAEDRDVSRFISQVKWQYNRKHQISLFLLHQNDHSNTPLLGQTLSTQLDDDTDAKLSWFGIRALGRFKTSPGTFRYWLDTASVSGEESRIDFDEISDDTLQVSGVSKQQIRGWAYDAGVTFTTNTTSKISLSLGYAFGSGDANPDDDNDRNFQQTDLQSNNNKFRGVNRFRAYGEVLRPELSNLKILTLSFGLPLMKNSSLELVYHQYEQEQPADDIRGARVKIDPLGLDRNIGQEVDLIFGFEEGKHVELELIFGSFRSGKAYGNRKGEYASTAIFNFNYNF